MSMLLEKRLGLAKIFFVADHMNAAWKQPVNSSPVERGEDHYFCSASLHNRTRSASADRMSPSNSPSRKRSSSAVALSGPKELFKSHERSNPPAWRTFDLYVRGSSLGSRLRRWKDTPQTPIKPAPNTYHPSPREKHQKHSQYLGEALINQACRLVTIVGVADGHLLITKRELIFEPIGYKRRKSIERSMRLKESKKHNSANVSPESNLSAKNADDETPTMGASANDNWSAGLSYSANAILKDTRIDLLTRRKQWPLSFLRRILRRRYMFSRCALEFFWADGTSVLLAFPRSALAAHDIAATAILNTVNEELNAGSEERSQQDDQSEDERMGSEMPYTASSDSMTSTPNAVSRERSTTLQSSVSANSSPEVDSKGGEGGSQPEQFTSKTGDKGRDRSSTLSMPDATVGNERGRHKKVQSGEAIARTVETCIRDLKTPYLRPLEHEKASVYCEMWMKREISNFEYLMELNFLSGRTYHDLNQYPVFPWVLTDFRSTSLDLSDPNTYRDLSTPIPALNPDRHQHFMERFENNEDNDVPPFMHGSHYSRAGLILFFLLRCEPFTSLHIDLQSEKFDLPDRMFHNLAETWKFCYENDTMELIPEFYCMPEFLVNSSGLPLGRRQDGEYVDDVVLPPWAETADDFISTMRGALESEYVSQHLHHWVDLIFGYKQRGKAAVEARNVYYHLTYEKASPPEFDASSSDLASVAMQIREFGQTPSQLFREPHVERYAAERCGLPLFISAMIQNRVHQPSRSSTAEKSSAANHSKPASGSGQLAEHHIVAYDTSGIPNLPSKHPISNSDLDPLEGLRLRSSFVAATSGGPNVLDTIRMWLKGVPEDSEMSSETGSSRKQMLWSTGLRKQLKGVSWGIAAVCYLEVIGERIRVVYGSRSYGKHRWQTMEASGGTPFDFKLGKLRPLPNADFVCPNSPILCTTAYFIRAVHAIKFGTSQSRNPEVTSTCALRPSDCSSVLHHCSPVGLPWPKDVMQTGAPSSSFVYPAYVKKSPVKRLHVACHFVDGCVRWTNLESEKYDSWDPSTSGLGIATCLHSAVESHKTSEETDPRIPEIIAIGTESGIVCICELVIASDYPHMEESSREFFSMFQLMRQGKRPICLPGPLASSEKPVRLQDFSPEPLVERNGEDEVFRPQSGCALVLLENLLGHNAPVASVQVDVAHDLVLSGDEHGFIFSHSIRKGQLLQQYVVGYSPVNRSLPSPVVHGTDEERFRHSVWREPKIFTTLTHPSSPGKIVQVVGGSKIAVVWQPIVEFGDPKIVVELLGTFHFNGSILAVRYRKLFDEDGTSKSPISAMTASSDGGLLVCGTVSGRLLVYDASSLDLIMSGSVPGIAESESVLYRSWKSLEEATADGSNIESAAQRKQSTVEDNDQQFRPGITCLRFSESDNFLLCGDAAGRIIIVTDPVSCQRRIAESLREGLFSLYG
eukprot:gb/GECG01009746.1/.p1 GENE.gb/GECG01009746.1/~~gb/GECG01009746.1/.p1  ORF type:complete len:1434 (+),score=152.86 gb/GECG01009746.1/:1-4302(+)